MTNNRVEVGKKVGINTEVKESIVSQCYQKQMCKYEDLLSWNQEEVCNLHGKPVCLEFNNLGRGSNDGPEKRQVKSCRALLASGEKEPII